MQRVGQEPGGGLAHARLVEPRAEPRQPLLPDEDRFGDGEVGDELQFLVDEPHPELVHEPRGDGLQDLAAEPDRAGVAGIDAGQDLDQRRFSGTVLADQAMDLARGDDEVGAGQGLDARERFGDPRHLQAEARRSGHHGRGDQAYLP